MYEMYYTNNLIDYITEGCWSPYPSNSIMCVISTNESERLLFSLFVVVVYFIIIFRFHKHTVHFEQMNAYPTLHVHHFCTVKLTNIRMQEQELLVHQCSCTYGFKCVSYVTPLTFKSINVAAVQKTWRICSTLTLKNECLKQGCIMADWLCGSCVCVYTCELVCVYARPCGCVLHTRAKWSRLLCPLWKRIGNIRWLHHHRTAVRESSFRGEVKAWI